MRQTSHQIDVVRAYVNSFRAAGLRVGLYYSILSLRDDIRHFNITPGKVQLTSRLGSRAIALSAGTALGGSLWCKANLPLQRTFT